MENAKIEMSLSNYWYETFIMNFKHGEVGSFKHLPIIWRIFLKKIFYNYNHCEWADNTTLWDIYYEF